MEAFVFHILLSIVIGIGIAWGGTRIDRSWALVKYNKFTIYLVTINSMIIFYLSYSAFSATDGPPGIVLVLLALLSVTGIFGINEVFRAKAWFDDRKIYFQSPYGKKIIISYQDIISCKLTVFNNYVLVSKNGDKVRLSSYMAGIEDMMKYVHKKVI